jgi:hypothetical protein
VDVQKEDEPRASAEEGYVMEDQKQKKKEKREGKK